MFGRATITLSINPHSSFIYIVFVVLRSRRVFHSWRHGDDDDDDDDDDVDLSPTSNDAFRIPAPGRKTCHGQKQSDCTASHRFDNRRTHRRGQTKLPRRKRRFANGDVR